MKKIILILGGMFAVVACYSQTAKANGAATGNSGIVEPTINGKPYSQYKAEQDALKQQSGNKQTITSPMLPIAPQNVTKNNDGPKGDEINASKTVQSNKFVEVQQNAVVSSKGVKTIEPQQSRTPEEIQKAKQLQENNSSTKVETSKTEVTNSPVVKMPPVMTEESKTSNGNSNGTSPAKTAETKTVDPTGPGMKTKTE